MIRHDELSFAFKVKAMTRGVYRAAMRAVAAHSELGGRKNREGAGNGR